MAKWFPNWAQQEEKEEKSELPTELKDEISNSIKASLSPIEERLAGLASLSSFVEEYRKDKEDAQARREAAERAARAKRDNETRETDEDLTARLLSDPRSVISESQKPIAEALMAVRADNIKREVFEDRKDEFKYYHGEIKKEIDKILSGESLQFRNNPVALENTYYTVVGKREKEISEEKIKSRFASSSSGATGNNSKTESEELVLTMTDEMRRAARLSGISEDDYLKLVTKAAKAGEIDYV